LPMSAAIRRLVAVVLVTAPLAAACGKPANPDEHFKKANDHAQQGRLSEAAVEYRLALQADPKRGDIRFKFAELLMRNRDFGLALGEYVRAADLLPNDAEAQVKAGSLLLLAQRFEDAKTRATKALEIDPKNAEAQILLGNTHAGLKDLDSAITEYQAAIALDPNQDAAYANIGAIQFTRGQKTEAEATFRKAIDVAPKSVNARMALANFLWSSGRTPEAEDTLKAALALDPDNLIANRALGTFYLSSNRAAEAEKYFQAIARVASTPETKIGLSDYYVIVKRYDDARKILRDLAQSEEQFAVATTRLAAIDAAENDRVGAMTKLQEVVLKHPKDMTARLLIARLLLIDGKRDEALKDATAIVTEEPTSDMAPAAYAMIGAIQASRDRHDEAIKAYEEVLARQRQPVVANIALAGLHMQTGNLDKAQTYAQQAITMQPKNPLARLTMVRLDLASGNSAKARQELAALQKEFPNAPPVLNAVATQQLVEKNFDAARLTYQKVLQMAPNDLEALAGLTRLDVATGRSKEALTRVEANLKTGKPTGNFLVMSAQTYAASGNLARAEELLKQAIDLEPARLQAYGMLGGLYARQNRLDDAKDQFRKVIERNPQSVPAYTMLGMLSEAQKKTPEAEEHYKKVLAIDPRAPVAANNLAWIYASSDRHLDEALQLAQTAHQMVPDEPHINDTLGWVYVKKNMGSLAIQHLERSIKVDPSDPAVHYHLGIAQMQAGDPTKARKALETALAAKKEFDGIADARATLAKLGR
jgi:cellulose synthase operon protein C